MWIPLTVKSHFSLQRGLSKPEQIVERCKEIGVPAVALTDLASVSGCPTFLKVAGKAKINGIAGSEFLLCPMDPAVKEVCNPINSKVTVLVTNMDGWKRLVRASSASASIEYAEKKPRLSLAKLAEFSEKSFIVLSGKIGTDLANCIFPEPRLAYSATSVEQAKSIVQKGWNELIVKKIEEYKTLFGAENFFIEVNVLDKSAVPALEVLATGLRWAARKTNTPCVATADSHYCSREDAIDQRVLLCSSSQSNMAEAARKLELNEDPSLVRFFRSNNFYIPTFEEMIELHPEEELANTVKIAERCESYQIGGKPMFPYIRGPKGEEPDDMLRQLCRNGWMKKIDKVVPPEKLPEYRDRVKRELDVLFGAKLSSYFLIVEDYISYARNVLGSLIGPGRGCFLPDTRVKRVDGTFSPIELLKQGDVIFDSYGRPQPVEGVFLYDIDEDIMEIELENGSVVRCTQDHRFLTSNRGWIEASELTDEDDIVEV